MQNVTESVDSSPLSLDQCLAKSRKTDRNLVLPGRLVLSHCQIVGEVARAIIQRLPNWLRISLFPDGSELIAASHDIGKVSPTFQKKIYTALSQKDETVLSVLREFNADAEKLWGGHGGVSQAEADAQNVGKYIPEILGQHHGYSPNLTVYSATMDVFGGQSWQSRRIGRAGRAQPATDRPGSDTRLPVRPRGCAAAPSGRQRPRCAHPGTADLAPASS